MDDQGRDGDAGQEIKAGAGLIVVIGAVEAMERGRDLLVEVAQGSDATHLLRLPASCGLLADLAQQIGSHGAQQVTLIHP
ncbi:hypothetical protein D3C87_942980 [compost metagenome]